MGYSQQFVSDHRALAGIQSNAFSDYTIYGVADFNSDGRPDFLVQATASNSSVAGLMLQNSNGTFTEKVVSNVPLGTATAIADVNGDGHADIVTIIPAQNDQNGQPIGNATLTIALGTGTGTFNVEAPITLQGSSGPSSVLVRDVNHDGKLDIITVSDDQYGDAFLQTFLNKGAGVFAAGPRYGGALVGGTLFASANLNADAYPDLVIQNNFQVQILLGKGDGSFTAGATYNLDARLVGISDVNLDHHLDLVVVTRSNTTAILLGSGTGTFTQSSTLQTGFGLGGSESGGVIPGALYVADLNGDGKPDIALISNSSTAEVAVYLGNGNGTFKAPTAYNIGSNYLYLNEGIPAIFGDFNRDGHIDVVSASLTAGYTIAYGTAGGGFIAPVMTQTANPGSIAKGDFNHDGIEDVAVVDEALCATCTASVHVFLGTGKGYFLAPTNYTIPVPKGMIAVGDVNGDGKLDIVVARNPALIYTSGGSTTDDVAVLLGQGNGTFETPVGYSLLGAPAATTISSSAYLIDVNKDGKLDLVGDWGVALGKGNGQFSAPIALPTGVSGGIAALAPGDFENSGTLGLVVGTNTSSSGNFTTPSNLYVLNSSGNGSFTVARTQSVPGVIYNVTTAELTDDGLSDILYTYATNGTTDYYPDTYNLGVDLNKGQATFTTTTHSIPSYYIGPGYAPAEILTGDFNRDGNMDVALFGTFSNAGDVALFLGTGGGTLSGTPQFYQGSMEHGVVLDINGDGAPDIAGTTMIGFERLLNTGYK